MVDYGITNEGFSPKTFEILLSELETEEKATMDPELDVSPETILGNINAIYSRSLALLWDALRTTYSQLDPDNAEGVLLDNICKLSGLARRPAQYSFTTVDMIFSAGGVPLIPNIHFFSTENGTRFTVASAFTSPSAGTFQVSLRSEETGTLAVEYGAISIISTPLAGLVELENSAEINSLNSGAAAETDLELRNRRKANLSLTGSCTTHAIENAILGIQSDIGQIYYCKVFEATDEPTLFVEKKNSFKAIVYDSNGGSDWDDVIAQTIWNNKPSGILSMGNEDGYARVGTNTYRVFFERAQVIDLYIDATYYYTNTMPNATTVKTYIKDRIDSLYDVGDDIVAFAAASIPIGGFSNIKDVDFDNYKIGIAPGPTANDNIIIGFNEKPIIQVANINLTFAPFVDIN